MDRQAIVDSVKKAGVVGAGGAGFPTHVKLGADAGILLVNGAECEPLLHVDIHLLEHSVEEVADGIRLAMLATGAERAIIGIKRANSRLGASLRAALDSIEPLPPVGIVLLPNEYPMGDEHVLVHAATGRRVPPGGIPLAVGVVVINVETLVNVSRAVKGIPVTTKHVTVGGAVPKPFTAEVPIGIPVTAALHAAGVEDSDSLFILDGGPMMGRRISPSSVVTKTTKGILAFPLDHPMALSRSKSLRSMGRLAEEVCCQCRSCTDACPRHALGHALEPHRLMRSIPVIRALENGGSLTGEELDGLSTAFLCSECGACEVMGCTMGLSPRTVNSYVKGALASRGLRGRVDTGLRQGRGTSGLSSERLYNRAGLVSYRSSAPFEPWKTSGGHVELPLKQHVGAPSVPVVATGERVVAGQILARIPDGSLGAAVHASIEGTVEVLDDRIVIFS